MPHVVTDVLHDKAERVLRQRRTCLTARTSAGLLGRHLTLTTDSNNNHTQIGLPYPGNLLPGYPSGNTTGTRRYPGIRPETEVVSK